MLMELTDEVCAAIERLLAQVRREVSDTGADATIGASRRMLSKQG